jgi:hypothetical protein
MRTPTVATAACLLLLVGCHAPQTDVPRVAAPAHNLPAKPLAGAPTYATPEEAVNALYQAAKAGDTGAMARIVGLPQEDVASGDPPEDRARAALFVAAHDQFTKIVPESDRVARAFIGADNFPLCSPLVKTDDGRWFFDSAGGKEELINRTIGENELETIGVCRAYVQAQYEYYAEDRDGDDVLEYAQSLGSTRGAHDGLYWRAGADETESPLGPLIAEARAEGYLRGSARQLDIPKPYHGYLFRILTRQGPGAPGGAHDYVINGNMIAGFAMVASPAKWNRSGVMTFIVGPNGRVYQKNLGEMTDQIARDMAQFDPDGGWALVEE